MSAIFELVIDNFAGGGGASQGIEAALGRPVDYALNHDREAMAMHKANHPFTNHLTEDIWKVNPLALTQGRPVGLVWMSPDCKHFSRAKGGKPLDKNIRGLAWIAIPWAKLPDPSKPRIFILENVQEFAEWGPLLEDGTPCPLRKGLTFRRWWRQLEKLGYVIEMRELRMCDYGAPTSRQRLFIIARCDGLPIVWPAGMFGPLLTPWRTAAGCVDWDVPVPSIFMTKEEAKVWAKFYGVRSPKRPLVEATLRRLGRGVMRYVVNNPRPFIVPLTHQGSDRIHDIYEPFRTITGAHRGELALASASLVPHTGEVAAFLARHYGGHENDGAPLDIPMYTVTAKDHHALVTAHVKRDFGQSVGSRMDAPLGSITANGGGKAALVASRLIRLEGGGRDDQLADMAFQADPASGLRFNQVREFLRKYGSKNGSSANHSGVVTVEDEPYAIGDICMRMFIPRELFRAQGFPEEYIINPLIETKEGSGVFKPLSGTAQVRMCGNSVSPPVAEALVAANYHANQIAIAA